MTVIPREGVERKGWTVNLCDDCLEELVIPREGVESNRCV
jgi:hypothetical protein